MKPLPATAVGLAAALSLELAFTRLHPWFTPDTAGYLAAHPWPACLGQPRIPVYGWLVNAAAHLAGFGIIPWLQFGLFAAATLTLVESLAPLGLPASARAAAGLAISLSNVSLIWTRALMPAAPAVAFLLLAMAGTISLATAPTRRRTLLTAAAACLAWLLDPGLLTFIFILPAILLSLTRQLGRPKIWRPSLRLFAACLAPFLLISSVRAAETGNFNIVSFGGFQMSGMAALILTPAAVPRLPPAMQPLATAILTRRTAQEAAGTTIATPRNSFGQASFPSEAIGYFDILARTHDSVLYGAVAPQQSPTESWVAFNTRMQRFALATLRAAPVDYAAWVIGATARLAGHVLIMNPAFLLPALAAMGLFIFFPRMNAPDSSLSPLLIIIIWYTLGAAALSILITFPAQRYIDIAGLWLPTLPIYLVLRRFEAPRPATSPPPGKA